MNQMQLAGVMSSLVRAYAALSTLELKGDADARWKFKLGYKGQSLVGYVQTAYHDPKQFEANPPTVTNCVSAAYSYSGDYRHKDYNAFRQSYYFKSLDIWVLPEEAINARWQEIQTIGARGIAIFGGCFGCNYEELANWHNTREGQKLLKELGIQP